MPRTKIPLYRSPSTVSGTTSRTTFTTSPLLTAIRPVPSSPLPPLSLPCLSWSGKVLSPYLFCGREELFHDRGVAWLARPFRPRVQEPGQAPPPCIGHAGHGCADPDVPGYGLLAQAGERGDHLLCREPALTSRDPGVDRQDHLGCVTEVPQLADDGGITVPSSGVRRIAHAPSARPYKAERFAVM